MFNAFVSFFFKSAQRKQHRAESDRVLIKKLAECLIKNFPHASNSLFHVYEIEAASTPAFPRGRRPDKGF